MFLLSRLLVRLTSRTMSKGVSGFLAKIGGGAATADSGAAPEPPVLGKDGSKTYTVRRRFLAESVRDTFGLNLTSDNEIRSVAAQSLGCYHQLPVGHIILYVNGVLVETNDQLYHEAAKKVDCELTCYSAAAMDELIARFVESKDPLDFDELQKTTPRFDFLSMHHPLHLHWAGRLRDAKETKDALAMFEDDLEEEMKQKEEQEAEEAMNLLMEMEEQQSKTSEAAASSKENDNKEPLRKTIGVTPPPQSAEKVDDAANPVSTIFGDNADDDRVPDGGATSPVTAQGMEDDISDAMLMEMIQSTAVPDMQLEPAPSAVEVAAPIKEVKVDRAPKVVEVHHPSREELKEQEGPIVPIPYQGTKPPPPAEVPLDLKFGMHRPVPRDYVCHCCGAHAKHWINACPKRQADIVAQRERAAAKIIADPEIGREICRDFQRGACNRGDTCIWIHARRRERTPERPRDRHHRDRDRDDRHHRRYSDRSPSPHRRRREERHREDGRSRRR